MRGVESMYYLSLDNQVLLLVILIFSSYIFISSLAVRLSDTLLKTFGLAFSIPIVLGCYSFLISPFNRNIASLFMDVSWASLLLMLTVVTLIRKTSETTKFLFLVVFLVPLAFIIMQNLLMTMNYRLYIAILILSFIIIHLAMTVFSLLSKNMARIMMHLGILLLSAGMMLFLTLYPLTWTGLVTAAGFVICSLYFYRYSYGIFYEQYRRNREDLNRMNNSVQMEVSRRVEEIERSNRKLLEISKTDSMTGLYVKSAVIKNLESLIERSPNNQISLMMFDIDKFKSINDSLGHQIGDKCIKALASLTQGSFRKEDILGRYGGDEFIVILPGAPPVKAYLIADRFRQLVGAKTNPAFTISVGVATFPQDARTAAALIESADKALYESKQKGRNRVTSFS